MRKVRVLALGGVGGSQQLGEWLAGRRPDKMFPASSMQGWGQPCPCSNWERGVCERERGAVAGWLRNLRAWLCLVLSSRKFHGLSDWARVPHGQHGAGDWADSGSRGYGPFSHPWRVCWETRAQLSDLLSPPWLLPPLTGQPQARCLAECEGPGAGS